jgi:hypothetical protein
VRADQEPPQPRERQAALLRGGRGVRDAQA